MTRVGDAARRDLIASSFDAVCDLEADDRVAALATLTPDIRAEVESLISALERNGDRLEPRRSGEVNGIDGSMRRIGAYRLVRLVGRGGMGAVYEAERADATYVKRVAIKLIRDDVGGEDVARRFARERAILAGLEHPNISRMLDGGTLDDGREYLVMEFVDGVPITTYCAARNADVRDRLELFLQVCDAVHFSHQHLVVHGDIKPGNLLVTADGTVKLVDFGVAKVIEEGDSRTRDPLTALGALTPGYASPEQWRGESLSILSDVYSLGIMLYELLTGARPFASAARTTNDIVHAMEAGARWPSAAVIASGPTDAQLSADRRRSKALAGELDTILLTALEANPRRRYGSVERFADDVRRHLDGRLVLAQPATKRYRFSKFLRRNRGSVAAGVALALALLGGGIAATIQARRANQARAVAERISGFLKQMLAAPDASWVHAGNADVRVADVLDAAAAQADTGLRSDPAAEAMVRRTIGAAYRALNRFDDADRQLNLALALDLKRNAPAFPDLAEDYHELGWSRYLRGDWPMAQKFYREANQRCGSSRVTDTSIVCYQSVADYALGLTMRGRSAEAESMYVELLRRGKLRFPTNSAPLAVLYGNLGVLADGRGDLPRAETMIRSAVGAWRSGPEPSERPVYYHSLALNQLVQGKLAEAEKAVLDGLRSVTNTHQERSLPAVLLQVDGAAVRRRLLDSAGASAYIARAHAAIPPNAPASHPVLSAIGIEVGLERLAAGDPVKAELALRDAERSRAAVYTAKDVRLARTRGLIGVALAAQGKFDDASALIRTAIPVLDSAYTGRHSLSLELHDALAQADSARAANETPAQVASRFARYIVARP
ncbi:MAG: serine/threonine-protein kinase [bacterium]